MTQAHDKKITRTLTGVVVSDKMKKTRVVAVTRMKKHSKYLKYYKTTTRFLAHDEKNESHEGDIVQIKETRPLSRKKRWRVIARMTANGSESIPNEKQINP